MKKKVQFKLFGRLIYLYMDNNKKDGIFGIGLNVISVDTLNKIAEQAQKEEREEYYYKPNPSEVQ